MEQIVFYNEFRFTIQFLNKLNQINCVELIIFCIYFLGLNWTLHWTLNIETLKYPVKISCQAVSTSTPNVILKKIAGGNKICAIMFGDLWIGSSLCWLVHPREGKVKICSMLSALLGKLSGLKILSRLILLYMRKHLKIFLTSRSFHYLQIFFIIQFLLNFPFAAPAWEHYSGLCSPSLYWPLQVGTVWQLLLQIKW